MSKLLWQSSLALATAAFLTACDETTNVTETTGPTSVAKFKVLDECTSENDGALVYVKDSAAAYLCSDSEWKKMSVSASNGSDGKDGSDGKNGTNGKDGKNGTDGNDGTSCTVKPIEGGYKVLCGGDSIGVLLNGVKGDSGAQGVQGKQGEPGAPGATGESCSVKENSEKNGYDLTCGDKVVTVTNGTNGEGVKGAQGESCTGKTLENGDIEITCGESFTGVLHNGTDGSDGKSAYELSGSKLSQKEWIESLKGESGESCTVVENKKENGYDIVCGENVKGTVKNGTNGTNCEIVSDKDGIVTLKCGDVETELYKAVCGTTPYDPAKYFCHDMNRYELCKDGSYDPTKYKCLDNQLQEKFLCGGIEYNPEKQFCAKRGQKEERPYKMVNIGDQTWTAENLDYQVENSWCGGGNGTEEGDCTKYGRLYTWAAAINNSTADANGNIQGICPDGWHMPSLDEWKTLVVNVDETLSGEWSNSNVAGGALKAPTSIYDCSDCNASGFSALPAGFYNNINKFANEGIEAVFWSTSESVKNVAFAYYMSIMFNFEITNANLSTCNKTLGISVRCIQDEQKK